MDIKREEKEKALSLVEESATFARREQLKSFLRFVCEYEASGRGGDLHEYLIGTEVLGQPTGYSTAENSVVRNRAHSLRQKLLEFYSKEAPDAVIRIEIPKGSYCPNFILSQEQGATRPVVPDDDEEPLPPEIPFKQRPLSKRLLFAGALLLCLASGLAGWFAAHLARTMVDPILLEAWGPLLGPNAHTMICVSTVPQLLVRSFPSGYGGPDYILAPKDLDLDSWYSQRYKKGPDESLYIQHYFNSPLWGDASGAISISRVLTRAGIDTQVLPERVEDAFALRGRNAFLLGRPENSPAAAVFLHGLYYNMKYFTDIQDEEIYFVDPKTGKDLELPRHDRAVHGLITIIGPSDQRKNPTRLVIISGVNSAGTVGAAEFFSSPYHMREFKARLLRDGYKTFPSVYQMVISTDSENYLPLSSSLETYRVIVP